MFLRAFFLSVSALPIVLYGLPQGAEVKAGRAECSGDAKSVEIRVSDKSIIEYQSFNIQEGEKVAFIQPSRSSTVLNRVVGSDPSSIWGQLEANGKIFLVNRNGIYFSPSAKVNVGSLVASTLDISDKNFWEESFQFQQNGNEDASIVNAGLLSASPEGFIALLAPQIQNNGVIAAKSGKVVCASGEKVTLDFSGDELICFTVQGKVKGSISQNGVIDVPEGDVFLRVGEAHHVLQQIVNTDGSTEAHYILEENGHIFLSASSKMLGGNIEIQGELIEAQGEVVATGNIKMVGEELIRFRDSIETPLTVVAYRDLTIESKLIDIFALKHEKTSLASGGATTLISDNPISADGHFYSGGNFSLLKTSGAPADFISLWDPVISATGSVSFGAYTGVSLLVQSTGRITPTGNIIITAPESGATITAGTERATLIGGASLILRAGLGALDASYTGASVFAVPPNATQGGATFTNTATLTGTDLTFAGTTITINQTPGPVGSIILAAAGGIIFGANTTINAIGASVTLSSTVNGDIAGRTLSIHSGSGEILFSTNLGNIQPLAAMALTTTSGNITLNGTVLGGNSTVTTGTGVIAFTGALNSDSTARTLTISTGASPSINFTSVGNSNPLVALNIDADGTAVSFSSAFTMGASSSITTAGGGVTFGGAVNGNGSAQTLTVNSSAGNVLFNTTVGSTQPIGLTLASTSGNITVIGACALGVNSTLSTTTGSIFFGSTLNADGAPRTLTITGGAVNFGGSVGNLNPLGALTITTAGTPITFISPLTLGASSTIATGGGAITFGGAVNGNATGQILTANSTGGSLLFNSQIGNIQPLGLVLSSNSGNITCGDNIILGGISTVSSTTGAIAFNGTLNSDTTLRTFTLSKGPSNTVNFGGAIGNVNPLGALTITTAGAPVTFASTLTLGASSTIATSGGNLTFSQAVNGNTTGQILTASSGVGSLLFNKPIGNIQPITLVLSSTAGNVTCGDNVVLGGTSTVSSTTGAIAFNGSLDSDTTLRTLTISKSASSGVSFGGAIGSANPLGVLTITTAGASVAFTGALTLGASSTITTSGGNITFSQAVNGNTTGQSLTTSSGAGSLLFSKPIGNIQPIALALSSTSGNITCGDNVILGGNSTVSTSTGAIAFNGTLNSDATLRTLTIPKGSSSSLSFIGAVGSIAPLGILTINVCGAPVTFSSSFTMGASSSISTVGGALTFNGAVNGSAPGQTLTASTVSGALLFNSAIGNIQPIGLSLSSSSGAITCGGNVILGGNSTVLTTTGAIAFNGTIDSDATLRSLTISKGSSNTVAFTQAVGSIAPLGVLTINTSNVPVTFSSTLTLGASSSITTIGGALTFTDALNGSIAGQTLTLNTLSGLSTFSGMVGNLQPIGLTLQSSSGGCLFTQALTLGGATTINTISGAITFDLINSDSLARALTINSGTGNISFTKGLASTASGLRSIPLGTITITTTNGNVTFGTVAGTGNAFFGATGTGINTITTGQGDVLFHGTTNGDSLLSRPLTITSDASVTFTGTVGNTAPFGAMMINAGTNILFSSAVVFNGAMTLNSISGNVNFASTLNNANIQTPLTITLGLGGAATFNGLIGGVNRIGNISITTATGGITFAQDLVLGGNMNLTTGGGGILFQGTVNGDITNRTLTAFAGAGSITFDKNIGNIRPLGILTANGYNITISSVGGGLSGVLDTMTLGAANAINFTGTTYNSTTHSYSGLFFNYTAGAPTTLASTTPQTASPSTLSMAFAPTTIQLSHGNDLQIITNGANAILPTILGSSPENVTILGGTGNITVGAIGVDSDIGAVFIQAGTVTLSDKIHCNTLEIESTGNILNSFGPETLTIAGNATFNSYIGTVGIKSSPIHVNSGGLIYAGSQTLAVLSGSSSDNTVHALPSNPPCVLIFNDTLLLNCNDPHFVPPETNAPSARPANLDVMFVTGIYNSFFNLGSDFYFLPDWIDENTLEHTDASLYYTHP